MDVSRFRSSVVKIESEGRVFEVTEEGLELVPVLSVASGVVVGDGRLVLTAAHVLSQSRSLRVTGSNGVTVDARPVSVDRQVDVAILRLEAPLEGTVGASLRQELPPLGSEVWVLGHPMGLEYSLTRGIVSALRTFEDFGIFGSKGHLIQLDAALNPGVSGGGLFDQEGLLVGVAGSIISRSGGFEGIGFGTAVDAIRDMLEASPCVWLGVDASPLPDSVALLLGIPAFGSFLVQQVFPGSLAETAGLRGGFSPVLLEEGPVLLGGDIILEINGLAECREACQLMYDRGPASSNEPHEILLTVWRRGERVQLSATSHRSPHSTVLELMGPGDPNPRRPRQ